MRRGKGTSENSREEKSQAPDMHYANASRARERDRLAQRSGRGRGHRGIFGSCLSSRLSMLLVLLALGFATYSFAVSWGYLEGFNVLSGQRALSEEVINQDQGQGDTSSSDAEGIQLQGDLDGEEEEGDQDQDGDQSEDDEIDDLANVPNKEEQKMLKEQAQDKADEKNDADEKKYDHVFKYHVLQTLTNTDRMPHLKTRFEVCMKSILEKSSVDLMFFFVVDGPSKTYLESTLQDITNQGIAKSKFQFIFLDIDDLAHDLAPLVEMMQTKIQGNHPYYKDSIFFLSTMLHMDLLPEYVHHVVMLDTDLKFMSDIKELFDHFDHFRGDNIMGVVHEQQPVYRHIFSLYRSQNRGTRVGDPPPNGLTGFNSGVLLLDLDRMRRSEHYREFLKAEMVTTMRDKYHFKGHLGDQDFYTLISMEKEDLFYNLPCSWNKQLCQWWKDKGYQAVWDQYYVCNQKINIYHGNCNTPIPY